MNIEEHLKQFKLRSATPAEKKLILQEVLKETKCDPSEQLLLDRRLRAWKWAVGSVCIILVVLSARLHDITHRRSQVSAGMISSAEHAFSVDTEELMGLLESSPAPSLGDYLKHTWDMRPGDDIVHYFTGRASQLEMSPAKRPSVEPEQAPTDRLRPLPGRALAPAPYACIA